MESSAETIKTTPKMTPSAFVAKRTARNAPRMAPAVVATSRNIPIRMLEYPSFVYAAAAPDDVAITEMSEAPRRSGCRRQKPALEAERSPRLRRGRSRNRAGRRRRNPAKPGAPAQALACSDNIILQERGARVRMQPARRAMEGKHWGESLASQQEDDVEQREDGDSDLEDERA